VEINAHGFRGPDVAPIPRPEHRVLVLGDSITFGNLLGVKATFSYQLQELLDAGPGDFQVLNFGVGGYDTLQEVALLAARAPEYRPDSVIVAYCLNDVGIVSTNLAFAEKLEARVRNPLFRLRADQIDAIDEGDDTLLALMNGVSGEHPSDWYRSRDRVGRLRFAFRWLAELSREEGFSVLVAIIPWLVVDESGYPHAAAHRIVAAEAGRAGLDVIDLTEPFMEAGIEGLRRAPADWTHPGELGHLIIAEALEGPVRASADARRR
jgi:lysophospholipase L1-like esterase